MESSISDASQTQQQNIEDPEPSTIKSQETYTQFIFCCNCIVVDFIHIHQVYLTGIAGTICLPNHMIIPWNKPQQMGVDPSHEHGDDSTNNEINWRQCNLLVKMTQKWGYEGPPSASQSSVHKYIPHPKQNKISS